MNCASCNARLAQSSTHCYLCGAAQPGHSTSIRSSRSMGRGPGGTYAHWLASSYPRSEGWRIWTSFFLAGLYAPIASLFLAAREEWTAGLGDGSLPPAPPSQRGAVVLALSLGLPLLIVVVLGYVVSTFDVRPSYDGEMGTWRNLQSAYIFAWLNIIVAGWYALSLAFSRQAERRFRTLLRELTRDDARSVEIFNGSRVGVTIATLIALLPSALILHNVMRMRATGWDDAQPGLALLYLLALCGAAWATSWLNMRPALRFRAVLFSNP